MAIALAFPQVWSWVLAAVWVPLMAVSRTYLLVHWATDVLAAAVLGASVALIVAAVVTGVVENGNLLISGSQEVRVNHELRILNVAGIVRPQDVDAYNQISYEKIAEARISYGGRGRLTEVQQPPWGQQAIDLFSPL